MGLMLDLIGPGGQSSQRRRGATAITRKVNRQSENSNRRAGIMLEGTNPCAFTAIIQISILRPMSPAKEWTFAVTAGVGSCGPVLDDLLVLASKACWR